MSVNSAAGRAPAAGASTAKWIASTIVALVAWGVAYSQLAAFSDWVVASTHVDPKSHLGEAVGFFAYDMPKVLMLLALVVFAMGVVRSFFSPEKTKALLAGRREGVGNVLAAVARHRHPVLLLLRRPAVHRFRQRRRAAGRHLLVPDLRTDGERGGARASVRAGRLESGADLSRLRPRGRHRRPAG